MSEMLTREVQEAGQTLVNHAQEARYSREIIEQSCRSGITKKEGETMKMEKSTMEASHKKGGSEIMICTRKEASART